MSVIIFVVAFAIVFYGGYRFGQYAVQKWLVGWKLIIVNPKGHGREWYFEKEEDRP